jgi:GTP-binding protein
VGRVTRGRIKAGQNVSLVKNDGKIVKGKVAELMVFEGLGKDNLT